MGTISILHDKNFHCPLARVENMFLQATTFCESTNLAMSTLHVLKMQMVGVFSTMFSIHKMSSILA
jgi:hypothetical protein